MQNQLVLMLKEPIEVIYSGLEEPIGQPKDIAANLKAAYDVNFDLEVAIPRPAISESLLSSNQASSSAKMIVDSEAKVTPTAVTPFVEEISQKSDFKK